MSIMSDDDFVRLFQRTFGLTEDGWAGRDVEAKLRELATLAGITVPAVPQNEIPDDYWPMLSRIESGDRPYVQAPTSTASGLYQFILKSWIGEGGAWGITDTTTIRNRQEERDHAAQALPDGVPDDRELRRRCRQLRDAGRSLPACRGPEGSA